MRGEVPPKVVIASEEGRRAWQEWPKGIQMGYSTWKLGGVEVQWYETYAETAGNDFLEDLLSKLPSFGMENDVRIVFWFG